MTLTLADQPWLKASATQAVMTALAAAGGPDAARFVGGCVRNAVIGAPIDDVDIATVLTPPEVIAALGAAGLKAVPTGIDHGTVTAISERQPFEITTLRRDVSTDGRRATVAFTTDWSEDAQRRDFRLNALYADATGAIMDPTGQGVADALAGRIVFVGDAATRIREDYLRILRFFRFFAWYGRGAPDAVGLEACAALKAGMTQLSAERVSSELLKLLSAPEPQTAMRLMADAGVLAQILPESGDLALFEAMAGRTPDKVLRLSALLPDEAAVVAATARRLRLSNAERDRLIAAVGAGPAVWAGMDERLARAALYKLGRTVFLDRLARACAASGDEAAALETFAADWTAPALSVGGRDLARLGVPAGPAMGRILKAFEASWIADDFPGEGHEARLIELMKHEDL